MSVKPLKYYSIFTLGSTIVLAFSPFSTYRIAPILGGNFTNKKTIEEAK
jgi:hypothetical protein